MTRIVRVFKASWSHSGKPKAVTATATIVLLILLGGGAAAGAPGFAQNLSPFGQNPQNPLPQMPPVHFPRRSQKQKQALIDYNFRQLKKHAKDLTELAKSLQTEIDKTNENVLSLKIVNKAEKTQRLAKKIQKLAKKIENEAKGQ